ncbi:uncharacterized protein LOC111173576 [Delphinapterus leucas]|uniref:Uncharacterized protein LOC111173576 n=1 Tax=Delphinapterus leucas TaxID=9749 RepID=A0A7F8K6F5_DELLE|nr:uncharacterized protein LOC111173576 [Delphinapterus leucas]
MAQSWDSVQTERARGSGAPGTRVPEWERARAPPGLPKRSCCAAPGGLGQSLGAAPPPVPPPAAARVRASRGSGASGRPPAAPAAQLPAPIAVPAFLTRPHLWGLRSGSGGPGTQASGASGPGGRPARRRGGRRAEPGECRLPARSPGSAPPERAREVRLCRAARPGDRGDLPARSPRSSRLCLPAWPVLRGRGRRGEHTWSAATPYLGDNSVTFQRVFSHLILANTFCHGKAHKPTASRRIELPPQAPGHRLPSLTAVQPSSCDAAQRATRFSGARALEQLPGKASFHWLFPSHGYEGIL